MDDVYKQTQFNLKLPSSYGILFLNQPKQISPPAVKGKEKQLEVLNHVILSDDGNISKQDAKLLFINHIQKQSGHHDACAVDCKILNIRNCSAFEVGHS